MEATKKRYARFYYHPGIPLGKDGKRVTASEEHIALSRKAAGEGMVLLKNKGDILPLKKGTKVALFGKACIDYKKGGGGSGDTFVPYVRDLYAGMLEKEKEGKISIYKPLCEEYKAYVEEQKKVCWKIWCDGWDDIFRMPEWETQQKGIVINHAIRDLHLRVQIPEMELSAEKVREIRKQTDVAVVSFCRYSGEDWDRTSDTEIGDFYLTAAERDLLAKVTAEYDKVVAVLNVGGMCDTSWFSNNDRIGAALYAWQAGLEGGLAEADILCGDVNPSGKLTDTFAGSFDDYPSSANFNESIDYVEYTDDIYVGYRYFETVPGAGEKVNYPFGFGLSYTTFAYSDLQGRREGDGFVFSARITNTGKAAGREAAQVYVCAPQGKLGKPSRVLVAFGKTKLLAPGESQTMTFTCTDRDLASFDDTGKVEKGCYVLEAGEYRFMIGTNVRDTWEVPYTYRLEKDTVLFRSVASCPNRVDLKRLTPSGEYELKPGETAAPFYPENKINEGKKPEKVLGFFRAGTELSIDDFMTQMTDEELVHVVCGQNSYGCTNTGSFGDVARLAIPAVPTADGPAGVRFNEETGVFTTAWPCATLLACTWDTELIEQIGKVGADEMRENNMGIWLAPGMNIHRSPLCGRNFEYYAEDPLVAGKCAAAFVRGVQSKKVAAAPKHFCCNNKETNRRGSDSRLSERALREIYIRGFEICIKEADPWTMMTSYNLVNGTYPSENGALLEGVVRREWGFKGMIMTDWTNLADHVKELAAGNDIHMPVRSCNEPALLAALKEGRLKREDLYASARRVLEMFVKLYEGLE